LSGNLEWPLARHRCRRDENIKIDITETGNEGVVWIQVVHDRVHWQTFVKVVMNLEVP
jgi:hypothetical protein